jgi:sarcosine oxidase subunit beta
VTPDSDAPIDAVPDVPGLVVATGFSGHDVMHCPSTGRIVSDLLLDGRASGSNVSALDLARFRRGELLLEAMVLHKGLSGASKQASLLNAPTSMAR